MNCTDGCGRQLDRHSSRGMCHTCYSRHYRAGTHIDYERRGRPRVEVLADWELLRTQGHTRRQAAERLGIKFNTFERAICRARAAQTNLEQEAS